MSTLSIRAQQVILDALGKSDCHFGKTVLCHTPSKIYTEDGLYLSTHDRFEELFGSSEKKVVTIFPNTKQLQRMCKKWKEEGFSIEAVFACHAPADPSDVVVEIIGKFLTEFHYIETITFLCELPEGTFRPKQDFIAYVVKFTSFNHESFKLAWDISAQTCSEILLPKAITEVDEVKNLIHDSTGPLACKSIRRNSCCEVMASGNSVPYAFYISSNSSSDFGEALDHLISQCRDLSEELPSCVIQVKSEVKWNIESKVERSALILKALESPQILELAEHLTRNRVDFYLPNPKTLLLDLSGVSVAVLVRILHYAEVPIPTSMAQGAFSFSIIKENYEEKNSPLGKFDVTIGRISALHTVPAQIRYSTVKEFCLPEFEESPIGRLIFQELRGTDFGKVLAIDEEKRVDWYVQFHVPQRFEANLPVELELKGKKFQVVHALPFASTSVSTIKPPVEESMHDHWKNTASLVSSKKIDRSNYVAHIEGNFASLRRVNAFRETRVDTGDKKCGGSYEEGSHPLLFVNAAIDVHDCLQHFSDLIDQTNEATRGFAESIDKYLTAPETLTDICHHTAVVYVLRIRCDDATPLHVGKIVVGKKGCLVSNTELVKCHTFTDCTLVVTTPKGVRVEGLCTPKRHYEVIAKVQIQVPRKPKKEEQDTQVTCLGRNHTQVTELTNAFSQQLVIAEKNEAPHLSGLTDGGGADETAAGSDGTKQDHMIQKTKDQEIQCVKSKEVSHIAAVGDSGQKPKDSLLLQDPISPTKSWTLPPPADEHEFDASKVDFTDKCADLHSGADTEGQLGKSKQEAENKEGGPLLTDKTAQEARLRTLKGSPPSQPLLSKIPENQVVGPIKALPVKATYDVKTRLAQVSVHLDAEAKGIRSCEEPSMLKHNLHTASQPPAATGRQEAQVPYLVAETRQENVKNFAAAKAKQRLSRSKSDGQEPLPPNVKNHGRVKSKSQPPPRTSVSPAKVVKKMSTKRPAGQNTQQNPTCSREDGSEQGVAMRKDKNAPQSKHHVQKALDLIKDCPKKAALPNEDQLMIDVECLLAEEEIKKQALCVEQIRDASHKWLSSYSDRNREMAERLAVDFLLTMNSTLCFFTVSMRMISKAPWSDKMVGVDVRQAAMVAIARGWFVKSDNFDKYPFSRAELALAAGVYLGAITPTIPDDATVALRAIIDHLPAECNSFFTPTKVSCPFCKAHTKGFVPTFSSSKTWTQPDWSDIRTMLGNSQPFVINVAPGWHGDGCNRGDQQPEINSFGKWVYLELRPYPSLTADFFPPLSDSSILLKDDSISELGLQLRGLVCSNVHSKGGAHYWLVEIQDGCITGAYDSLKGLQPLTLELHRQLFVTALLFTAEQKGRVTMRTQQLDAKAGKVEPILRSAQPISVASRGKVNQVKKHLAESLKAGNDPVTLRTFFPGKASVRSFSAGQGRARKTASKSPHDGSSRKKGCLKDTSKMQDEAKASTVNKRCDAAARAGSSFSGVGPPPAFVRSRQGASGFDEVEIVNQISGRSQKSEKCQDHKSHGAETPHPSKETLCLGELGEGIEDDPIGSFSSVPDDQVPCSKVAGKKRTFREIAIGDGIDEFGSIEDKYRCENGPPQIDGARGNARCRASTSESNNGNQLQATSPLKEGTSSEAKGKTGDKKDSLLDLKDEKVIPSKKKGRYGVISLFDGVSSVVPAISRKLGYPPVVVLLAECDGALRALVCTEFGYRSDEKWGYTSDGVAALYLKSVQTILENDCHILRQLAHTYPDLKWIIVGGSPCQDLTFAGPFSGLLGLTGTNSRLFFVLLCVIFTMQQLFGTGAIRYLVENAASMMDIHFQAFCSLLKLPGDDLQRFIWDPQKFGFQVTRSRNYFRNFSDADPVEEPPQIFEEGKGPLVDRRGQKLPFAPLLRTRDLLPHGIIHSSWTLYQPHALVWDYLFWGGEEEFVRKIRFASHKVPEFQWTKIVPPPFLKAWKAFLTALCDKRLKGRDADGLVSPLLPIFHSRSFQLPMRILSEHEVLLLSGLDAHWKRTSLSDENFMSEKLIRDFCGNSFHPALISAALGNKTVVQDWINGDEPGSDTAVADQDSAYSIFSSLCDKVLQLAQKRHREKVQVDKSLPLFVKISSDSAACEPLPIHVHPSPITGCRRVEVTKTEKHITQCVEAAMQSLTSTQCQAMKAVGLERLFDSFRASVFVPFHFEGYTATIIGESLSQLQKLSSYRDSECPDLIKVGALKAAFNAWEKNPSLCTLVAILLAASDCKSQSSWPLGHVLLLTCKNSISFEIEEKVLYVGPSQPKLLYIVNGQNVAAPKVWVAEGTAYPTPLQVKHVPTLCEAAVPTVKAATDINWDHDFNIEGRSGLWALHVGPYHSKVGRCPWCLLHTLNLIAGCLLHCRPSAKESKQPVPIAHLFCVTEEGSSAVRIVGWLKDSPAVAAVWIFHVIKEFDIAQIEHRIHRTQCRPQIFTSALSIASAPSEHVHEICTPFQDAGLPIDFCQHLFVRAGGSGPAFGEWLRKRSIDLA